MKTWTNWKIGHWTLDASVIYKSSNNNLESIAYTRRYVQNLNTLKESPTLQTKMDTFSVSLYPDPDAILKC